MQNLKAHARVSSRFNWSFAIGFSSEQEISWHNMLVYNYSSLEGLSGIIYNKRELMSN